MKETMLKFLNGLFHPFRLAVVRAAELADDAREFKVARLLLRLHARAAGKECGRGLEGVVFSKDRALQLHALLSSYYEQVSDPAPLTVLYAASNPEHRAAYGQVFESFKSKKLEAVFEDGRFPFKQQLIHILDGTMSPRVFFLVDDMLFIRPVSFSDLMGFDPRNSVLSLRLGSNLRTAYTTQEPQPLPELKKISGDIVGFDWSRGSLDWAYPLSLDGHIFWAPEMKLLARELDYRSPNLLEIELKRYIPYFNWRPGLCYNKSRTLNLPANRVQQDSRNLHGSVHQDQLLAEWQKGKQMDYRSLYGFENTSCHQDLEIRLTDRPQGGRVIKGN
jgi:hypothetical protein